MTESIFGKTLTVLDHRIPRWTAQLHAELLEHSYLVVRDVVLEAPEQLLEYGASIGEPIKYAFGKVFELKNVGQNDKRTQLSNRAMCIHQDSVLPDVFADIVIMYCWTAPTSGGESLMCDNRRFLSILREQRPDLYDFFTNARVRYKNHTPDYYATDKVDDWVEKPTLRLHPLLKQRLVYFAFNDAADEHRNFTAVFSGMTQQESDAKMAELSSFMRSSEVMTEHKLRAGDLIMFDNLLISHGRNGFPVDESRLLSRVQVQLP